MTPEYEAARLKAIKAACHKERPEFDWSDVADGELRFMQKLFDAGHDLHALNMRQSGRNAVPHE